jgi:hypothetical protein
MGAVVMARGKAKSVAKSEPVVISAVASRIKHVERITQIQSEFHRLPFDADLDPETEFAVLGAHGGVAGDGSHLVASVDLGFRLSALPGEGADIPDELLDEKTGRVVIAYVRAAYMVTYAIESGDTLAATDIEEFCRVNAIHTAWPFWREFITSSLSRGGLEAVPVPMFNVYGSRPKPVTYVPENP